MEPNARKEQNPDPLAKHLQRIEGLRRKVLPRSPAEAGGWLMGFSVGFAEGLRNRGTTAPPKLPPPLSQMPPTLAWERARSQAWQSAWQTLLQAGLDLGVHFGGEGEERVKASLGDEKAYAAFVLGYEEGLLVGYAMGKNCP